LDSRCTCFSLQNGEVYGAIRVNLVGREPRGRIRPGAEYDGFCETLTRDLCALINAETGQPAVRRVLRTAELYQGPHLDALPDLLVEWNCEAPLTEVHSAKTGTIRRTFDGQRTGHHKREGLLIATGPGIRPGQLPAPVSITDVAPTVASLLGVPLPNVEGRPIAVCDG
jgi:predicted AlkP superfamily phosphohydrolase/phosphomutase